MISQTDPWTVINRTDSTVSTTSSIMSPITETQPSTEPQAETKVVELTINAKPTPDQPKENDQAKEKVPKPEPSTTTTTTTQKPDESKKPRKLPRTNSQTFILSSDDSDYDGGRIRRSSPRIQAALPLLSSSSVLFEKLNTFDGVIDLPYPGRAKAYLTTYPFAEKDVQRWSWVLGAGIEEAWVRAPKPVSHREDDDEDDDDDDDDFVPARGRGIPPYVTRSHRVRSPGYDPLGNSIASIFLSRALDTDVVPEDGPEKAKYVVVVQNRSKNGSSAGAARLLVPEGRKAAGMLIYFEALNESSVVFVGAVAAEAKLVGEKKRKKTVFRRAETWEEAVRMWREEGVVGVVC